MARPRSRFAPRLTGLVVLSLLGGAFSTFGQGPPPHVRRLVDAVVQLLGTQGDAAIASFVDSAVDPAWPAKAGKEAVSAHVRQVRDAARGVGADVSVEGEPDGVRLVLRSGDVEQQVRIVLSEAGIRGLTMVEGQAARAAGPEGAIRAHVRAFEDSGRDSLEAVLSKFEGQHFSENFMAETTRDERRALLEHIRRVAATAGGAMLDERGNGEIVLRLRGPESVAVVFELEAAEPFAIDALRLETGEDEPALTLTWENAAKAFEDLERDGFSGVVHLERNGKPVLHQAYGMSNPELGLRTRTDTVYGIGSTPIDFTVAAIHLLAQQGHLKLDDPIGKHVDGVPADKRSMTVTHLISGRSGLPDFHDLPGDWDADLAWIDRETAIRRILAQPLLFAPGTSRAHSHSAYGLAAAVVEIVSGQDYFTFCNDNLFRPAGMTRTGMYGVTGGLGLQDFAVGPGPSRVGLPNIPPNWGPTSWLVLGSGGMYSTMDDLLRFRDFVASDKLFEPRFRDRYAGEVVGVGGSDRGFYVFHASSGDRAEGLMILNGEGRTPETRALSRAIERLILEGGPGS